MWCINVHTSSRMVSFATSLLWIFMPFLCPLKYINFLLFFIVFWILYYKFVSKGDLYFTLAMMTIKTKNLFVYECLWMFVYEFYIINLFRRETYISPVILFKINWSYCRINYQIRELSDEGPCGSGSLLRCWRFVFHTRCPWMKR